MYMKTTGSNFWYNLTLRKTKWLGIMNNLGKFDKLVNRIPSKVPMWVIYSLSVHRSCFFTNKLIFDPVMTWRTSFVLRSDRWMYGMLFFHAKWITQCKASNKWRCTQFNHCMPIQFTIGLTENNINLQKKYFSFKIIIWFSYRIKN